MKWLLGELRRLQNTARWSYQGWASAWAREKSLRQWAVVNALSVALSLVVEMSAGEPDEIDLEEPEKLERQ